MALQHLDTLAKETLNLFGQGSHEKFPNESVYEFREFVDHLHHAVLIKTNEIWRWNPSDPRVYPLIVSVLLIQLMSESSLPQTSTNFHKLPPGPFRWMEGSLQR